MKFLKYIIITLIVIIPSVLTVFFYNDKIVKTSPVYYKQGVEFYNKGDYSNAFYNFSRIKWLSPLYPMALYKQATCAQKLGDYKSASTKYRLFLEKVPNSVFENQARYNLAKSYYYLKKYPESKEQFLILKEKYGNNPCREDYYLGLICKQDDKNQAAKYFKDYLQGTLDDKIQDKNFMVASNDELVNLGVVLNDKDNQLIAKSYYINGRYSKALEYFSKLPISSFWDYIVIINHSLGNKVVAKKLIEDGIVTHSGLSDEDRLHSIYDIYTSYMTGSKIRNWTEMLNIVQSNSLKCEDYVLYKLALLLPFDKSINLYNQIIQKYPKSNYAPESMWNVFWNKYLNKDYINAEIIANKHLETYKNVNSTTRMLFWLAKVKSKLNKNEEAKLIYSDLASKYSDDYYGLRAEYILSDRNDFWVTRPTDKISINTTKSFPITLSGIESRDMKMINTVFNLGDYDVWADADCSDKVVESWFALKKEKKSRSVVIARELINKMEQKPKYSDAVYKLAYPLHWVNELNIIGKNFHIDPWIIISIIREESHFNENAVSSTNAVGLMQLMPGTANYIVSKFSINIPTSQDLVNPRVNMYLGCYYLKYLKERFNNDLYVVAAYNGGEGSVNKWSKAFSNSDNDEFIERIPFEETRNYVKKVFRSYHLYKKVYAQD